MLFSFARSIAVKVALAFSLVGVTLVVSYIVMAQRLDTITNAMDSITAINTYSTSVIRLNKDIIEMQRNVSVYSGSGSDAVFDKIEESFADIKARLDVLSEVNVSKTEREDILALAALVDEIGDNLKDLSLLYNQRALLIDGELEKGYQLALQELYLHERDSENIKNKLKLVELINNWHMLHRNAWLFLSKKDYQKRQEVNKLLRGMSLVSLENQSELSKKLQELARNYQTYFFKSVQVNRNYFNLVNVVMAGNIIEFGNIASMLREHSLVRVQEIRRLGHEKISTTEVILNILGIAIIMYLVLLALFFHLSITKAIVKLTGSFSRFLNGDLSAPISHIYRKDEIGVLAQAASRFRDMSKDLEKEKHAAERTSKVKSEFLANMSHEIRTPMNGILGMAEQLSSTNLSATQKNMLDIITSSGKSLLVIINDILDLSKIEAEKIELERRPVALGKLLREMELLFKGQAVAKGVRLSSHLHSEGEDVFFIGDETRIKQILMNLLGNAIKFTDQGDVTLVADVIKETKESIKVVFSVSDTGIGIEPHNVEKLFEAFSQADTSITRKFGGTGLGLTITSKLLALMGSELRVESEVRKGSKFFFVIDASECSGENLDIELQSNDTELAHCDFSRLTILVAEDNKTNQIVLKGFLNKLGVGSVTVAENGEEAINLCVNERFDLVFMDMQMPVKDGLQATIEIKRIAEYREVPIIALTANVLEEDKKRCSEVGMCDFVGKPINVTQLERTIRKWSKTDK